MLSISIGMGFSSFKIGISTMALAKTYQITIHEISGNHFFSGIKTKKPAQKCTGLYIIIAIDSIFFCGG
jgi:hypothetical protein